MTWDGQAVKEKKPKAKPKIEFKTLLESKKDRGIKILSYGSFSTGKTHFALSSEKPVYIIDTENGAAPLADKFPDANILNICNMDANDIEEKDEVNNFENFQEAINHLISLPDDKIGTIIIDSVSDIWDWAQAYAKTKIFKIPVEQRFAQQFDWGVPTKLYLKQIQKLINKNCNIVLCARAGEEYAGAGQPTGKYKPQCQKKTPYWVDIVLFHEVRFINKQLQFQAKIEKCRQKGEIINKIIENPNLEKIKEMLK